MQGIYKFFICTFTLNGIHRNVSECPYNIMCAISSVLVFVQYGADPVLLAVLSVIISGQRERGE